MFNLSHPKAQNEQWALDPMLFTEKLEHTGFHGQDWDKVPKVAYETALFRKLAPPRMAKVVTNPSSFVLETYGAPVAASSVTSPQSAQSPLASGMERTKAIKEKEIEAQHALSAHERGADADLDADAATTKQEDRLPSMDPLSAETSLLKTDGEEASASVYQDEHLDKDPAVGSEERVQDADLTAKDKATQDVLEDSSSKSFDEGFQSGLLKGVEQAQQKASEEFQAEKIQLNEQISTLQAQCSSLEAHALELQTKMDEMAQTLTSQNENLESERENLKAQNALALGEQVKLLEEVTSKLDDFVSHPQRLFEPLKRLSVHIAEQLVLAELNLSGASIERLIQRCLDELSSHSNQTVTVELNSQDKARLQEMTGEMFNHIQLHAVSSMQPGSVRVITDDTQVDDLIGHRLEALANNLLAQPELWREQSPFFKQPLAQRDTDIEDVRQRLAPVSQAHEEDHDD